MGEAARNVANVDLKVLPRAMANIAPLANKLGLSFEEATAELITLGEQAGGPRGFQTAASAFEILLRELTELEPGSAGDALLRQLEIDPADIGRKVGIGQLFERLKGASDDTLREIFGPEYISDVLLRTTPEAIARAHELNIALTGVTGAARDMADKKNLGLPGVWADLGSAINELNIALGKAGITRTLEIVLGWFKSLADAIANTPGPIKMIIAGVLSTGPVLLGLGAALKVVSLALGGYVALVKGTVALNAAWRGSLIATRTGLALLTVKQWLANAAQWALNLSTTVFTLSFWRNLASLAALRIGMLAGAVAASVATAAQWALNAAMWANPIGLIVLGIVALIAALGAVAYAIYRFRDAIIKGLKTAWNWVKPNWPLLAGILLGPFGIVGALVWKFRDDIVDAFQTAWWHVKDFFNRFGKYVGLALLVVAPFVGIPLLIARNWGQIVGIIGDVWSRVTDTVRGWINAIIALIKEFPGRVLDVMKNLPGQVLDAIPGGGALKAVGSFLGFQEGGIVPGAQGQAVPAVLHGGELVVPGRAVQSLHDFLSSIEAMRLPETTGQPQPAHQAASVLSHLDMLFSRLLDAVRLLAARVFPMRQADQPVPLQESAIRVLPISPMSGQTERDGEALTRQDALLRMFHTLLENIRRLVQNTGPLRLPDLSIPPDSPFAENMRRVLDGGLGALTGPSPVVAMAGGGTTVYEDHSDRSINISEGAIVVHAAPGQDPEEIAKVVNDRLRDQIQSVSDNVDSSVKR